MVYAVHGVTDRDHNELVLMFFDKFADAVQFTDDLPGTYDILAVSGVTCDDIEWTANVYDKRCVVCENGIRIGEEAHTDEETGEDCHAECCSTCNEKGV